MLSESRREHRRKRAPRQVGAEAMLPSVVIQRLCTRFTSLTSHFASGNQPREASGKIYLWRGQCNGWELRIDHLEVWAKELHSHYAIGFPGTWHPLRLALQRRRVLVCGVKLETAAQVKWQERAALSQCALKVNS